MDYVMRATPGTLGVSLVVGIVCSLMAVTANAASVAVFVRDQNGAAVANAVVSAHVQGRSTLRPVHPPIATIEQVGMAFVPRVLPVLRGTRVRFPNLDTVQHHVYSFSTAKQFQISLYAGEPAESILFDKPGVVVLGCNIHDGMLGYVYVLDTPHFAKTNKSGRAYLDGVIERTHELRIWHPRLIADGQIVRRRFSATARDGDSIWVSVELAARKRTSGAVTRTRSAHSLSHGAS